MYPSSDQFLDNAVMVSDVTYLSPFYADLYVQLGLYIVFSGIELAHLVLFWRKGRYLSGGIAEANDIKGTQSLSSSV